MLKCSPLKFIVVFSLGRERERRVGEAMGGDISQ